MSREELIEYIKNYDLNYKEVDMEFYEHAELEMIKNRIERENIEEEKSNSINQK